ncbi:MAG: protein kinase [Polyangiaceae bacterium]
MALNKGELLASRYRAEELLGRGGMGEVWRCTDLEENRIVAIKSIVTKRVTDEAIRRLFHEEVLAVARLDHPGIVEIYDFLEAADGTVLLVMAYRAGRSLDRLRTLLPAWSFVRAVLQGVLEALAHAHARGVLHLDVKPQNVIVRRENERTLTTLVDFGVARVHQPGRGAERWADRDTVFGTLEYMAPEQFRGQLAKFGPWTDLYAVGMMAYELASGALPFQTSNPLAAALKRASEPIPHLVSRTVNLPDGFNELVLQLLDPSPANRPACAADVLAAIARLDRASNPGRDGGALQAIEAPSASVETADVPPSTMPRTVTSATDAAPDDTPAPPSSASRVSAAHTVLDAGEAERAFTQESSPTPGAYGLFGLRDLGVLGRVEERRRLWAAVGTTGLEGRPRAVILEGPAGTGKSRLARDAIERALELGLANSFATTWSTAQSPDGGLRGLVENALETRGRVGPDFRTKLAFWLQRFPAASDTMAREIGVLLRPEVDAAPDAGLAARVAADLVRTASAARPVLLWLDDAQWSRGEAPALLHALAEQFGVGPSTVGPASLPVCVLITIREDEISKEARDELGRAVERLVGAGVERITMAPLEPAATRTLVRGLLDLEDDLADMVVRRSEGNPLFVTQLINQLVRERVIVPKAGRYGLSRAVSADDVLPADMEAVWARRVAISGADITELQALAIVRERVAASVAAELTRLRGPAFARALDVAQTAGLVRKEGELYGFSHGLLRSYVVATISAEARPELAAVGAAALAPLVDHEDVQEERAVLLRSAGKADEARRAMLDAALWSWRRLEQDQRGKRLEVLLEWAEADHAAPEKARALAELANLHGDRGQRASALELVERARAIPSDGEHRAWILIRAATVLRLQGRGEEANVATCDALDTARRSGTTDVEALALMMGGLDARRRGDPAQARVLYDQALDAAQRANNRPLYVQSLSYRSVLEAPDESEATLRSAMEMARAAGALRVEIVARHMRCEALWRQGARKLAREEIELVAVDAGRAKMRQLLSMADLMAGAWALEEESWDDVEKHRNRALAHGAKEGALAERAHLWALEIGLLLHAGRIENAQEAVTQMRAECGAYSDATFGLLVAKLRTLSPPQLTEMLGGIST